MTKVEMTYLFLACYSIVLTTINTYLLCYKLELDKKRDRERRALRESERERRAAERQQLEIFYNDMQKMYFDIIGGKYEK